MSVATLLSRVVHASATWGVTAATTLGAAFGAADLTLMLVSGMPARPAVASALASASLAIVVSLSASPALAVFALGASAIARGPTLMRHFWWAPIALTSLGLGSTITGTARAPVATSAVIAALLIGFATVVCVSAAAARTRHGWMALVAGFAIALAGFAASAVLIKAQRDLHMLAASATAAGLLAMTTLLRRRLMKKQARALALPFALLGIGALASLACVDRLSPDWRARAWQFARYEPLLASACRSAVDVDLDGFSPVAWGGDCDDFDSRRHPLARERPGVIDANCNGVTPTDHPSDEDRGLAPAVGDPDMPESSIDRVVLVTIDCMRADALRPDVMPNLWAMARGGVRFSRMYAAGSRTIMSVPLMHRGFDDAAPMAERLEAVGVRTTGIFSLRDDIMGRAVLAGFVTRKIPVTAADERWNATTVTDHAIAALQSRGASRQLVWAHYFDAHAPYLPTPEPLGPFVYPLELPASYEMYLSELAYIDRELRRLFAELERTGGMSRTVLVVTADHGEGFGKHGIMFHGVSGYENVLHVPAIVLAPGLAPSVHDHVVSLRDVPPTVLGAFALASKDPHAERFGRSWLRLRAAPDAPLHRFVVARSARAARKGEALSLMAALVEDRLKLIETFEDGLVELYEPTIDPDETRDLVPTRVDEVVRTRRALALYRDLDRFP